MPVAPSFTPRTRVASGRHHRRLGSSKTLTAAADATAGGIGGASVSNSNPTRQGWQKEGWGFYNQFPELHYGAQFVGSCWSRVRLRLGWVNDNGDVAPVYNEDGEIDEDCPSDIAALVGRAQTILSTFTDPLGGTGALLEAVGKNITVS